MANATGPEAQAFLDAWFDARRVVQALNFNRFQQEGLSAGQFIVLDMVGRADAPLGAADLARRLNVDVTSAMRTVASLEGRGLLRRTRSPQDRRKWLLDTTPDGRAVFQRMHAQFVGHVATAFAALSQTQRRGLIDGLRAFVTAADGVRPRPGGPRRGR